MCHPELHERHDRLEVCSPMRAGMRVVFAVLALFPLLAPYELIVKVEWESYLHPFFLLAALISVGATALSAFLVFAAVAGLSSQMIFDARAATFTYSSQAPLVRPASQVYPLAEVVRVELRKRDWSDSAPSYHLGVVMAGGAVFESGSSWSRGEIESLRARVEQFLLGTQGERPHSKN